MSYKLMIKTHNITHLKYLCITTRDDHCSYTGSGAYWKDHLAIHGYDFSTEVLFESDDYAEFVGVCVAVSEELDVALSEEFANLVPETGYNNNDGKPNVVLFWQYVSEDVKKLIVQKRAATLKNGAHWAYKDNRYDVIQKLRISQHERFDKMTLDERRQFAKKAQLGALEFFQDKGSKYDEWKAKISITMKAHFANIPFEVLSERNRKHRLGLSEESKVKRRQKIRDVYASGKHDHLFDRYSKERQGVNNPAAKKILWYGTEYTKLDFEKKIGLVESFREIFDSREDCKILYDENPVFYETMVCPYCGKSTSLKPSSFKRWHFENCKHRSVDNEKSD